MAQALLPPLSLLLFVQLGQPVLVRRSRGGHSVDFVGVCGERELMLHFFDPIRGGVQRKETAVDFHLVFFAQYHTSGLIIVFALLKTYDLFILILSQKLIYCPNM